MKTAASVDVRTPLERAIACLASLALAAALVPAVSLGALSEVAWADPTITLANYESGSGTTSDPYIYTYTGSAIDLGASVSDALSYGYASGQITSSSGVASLSSGSGPTDAGSYTYVAFDSTPTYVFVYFTVQAASLSDCTLSADDLTWTGESQTPTLTLSDSNGDSLGISAGCTASYYAASTAGDSSSISATSSDGTTCYATGEALTGVTDIGTYIATVTGDGTNVDAYTTLACVFSVVAAEISDAWTLKVAGGSGDGSTTFCPGTIENLSVTVVDSEYAYTPLDSSYYEISYADSSGNAIESLSSVATAQTITVTATGTGNYQGTLQTTVTVSDHSVTYTSGYNAATCTAAGNLEYVTCSLCNKTFALAEGATSESPAAGDELESTTIAATGHTYPTAEDTQYVTWDFTSLPSAATVTITCTACGTTLESHQCTGDEITSQTTAASYTSAGSTTYTCTYASTNANTTYTGTYTVSISQLSPEANTITVKAKKVTVKGKTKGGKLKGNVVLKRAKLMTVKKAMGTVTCKKSGATGGKLIKVAKNGKLTLKKGLKAGTYTVKIKVTAAGGLVSNVNYNSKSKTVKVKITVK